MRAFYGIVALAALAVCFVAPFRYLSGSATMDGYKSLLLSGSLAYLIFATLWVRRRK